METLLASCPVSTSHRVCINPSILSRADTHIMDVGSFLGAGDRCRCQGPGIMCHWKLAALATMGTTCPAGDMKSLCLVMLVIDSN